MEERKSLLRWIKEHKKILVAAGIGVGALILIILGIRNRESVQAAWELLWRATEKPDVPMPKEASAASAAVRQIQSLEEHAIKGAGTNTTPFGVSGHIRNLPDGWHASPEKVAEALKRNITLLDGQTLVDDYMKRGPAA